MGRYRIGHIFKEDPDDETFARSLLELLLKLDEEGLLTEILNGTECTDEDAA